MLSSKKLKEIKEHLDRAQNPLFLYDNDEDGLCAFIILRRYTESGKGVAIKSYPSLSKDYIRKIIEFNSDYVFILDKPVISEEFFEEIQKINIPIVWIDHHQGEMPNLPPNVYYYNPVFSKNSSSEPTTYICQKACSQKSSQWIAVLGSIADRFLPPFYKDFQKKYPELCIDSDDPFKIAYKSELGNVLRIIGFSLKDRITNVVKMQNFLIKAKSPHDILNESKENMTMHARYNQINNRFQVLRDKAKTVGKSSGKILFFKFAGDLSIAADLSNELGFLFPKKIIVVGYMSGSKINLSVRGEKIRSIFLNTIEGLEEATGGGHENAVGGKIRTEDFDIFQKKFNSFVTRR